MNRMDLLRQYLDESPDDPFLIFALAKEFEKIGDDELALEKYRQLKEEHADYVGTYYHLGKLLVRIDQIGDASKVYRKGINVAKAQNDLHSRSELEGALLEIGD